MNIVIFGAGAIGSLFGALLNKNNNVALIARKNHIEKIRKNGLKITNKTKINIKIDAVSSFKNISFKPNLIIISVKSFDTKKAVNQISNYIEKDTIILSLQNGLDNIEKIKKKINSDNIIAAVTTHGAFFSKPGLIEHTGLGFTIIGGISNSNFEKINLIASLFKKSGIEVKISKNISKDIWAKSIINSSINPITTIFNCKNGYLLRNPILEKIVERICIESTLIANSKNFNFSDKKMINLTKNVIKNTSDNFSSMLQSYKKKGLTEIDSINGIFVKVAKKSNINPVLNEIILKYVKHL